jgi:hypothetical protein
MMVFKFILPNPRSKTTAKKRKQDKKSNMPKKAQKN